MAALGDFEEILSEPNKDCTACVATRRRAIDCRAESGAVIVGNSIRLASEVELGDALG